MRILQRFLIFSTLMLGFIAGSSSLVWAQTVPAKPSSGSASSTKGPRKQTLSFEDELVEGSTQKPELFYLFQKKNFNYKRLIKLRDNFLPEMKRSTEDIQRGRSNN
jgi:hypothetical protein